MKNFIKPILGFQWLCLLCLCGTTATAFAQAPTNGLVAYYPFNGNANDESGHGYNATSSGAILAIDRFGNTDKAYNFNGVNNYINAGNSSVFNMSNQMTISTWFKMTGDGSEPSQGGILVNKEGEYEIAVFNDNTIRWAIGVSGATGWDWTNTNITINRNEWYHMTFIYNGGIIKLFLNGNLVYTQNTNITVIGDVDINLNDLRIGGRSCCGGQYFNGKIDEVRLYNRALSQTEVSQLYQTENSRLVCTNPVGQPTHTASFNYQIGTGTASMRFGDGQTAALTGTSGTITHAYNKTGIYYAELLKDNIPVDTFAVTVKTCGWISKVGTYWCNPFFNDVQTCTAVTGNGIFHIPVNPGAAVCGEYASYTERFQDFGVSGDNCSYEIRAKDPVSEGGCPIWKDVNLIICGKKSTAGVSILDGNTYWPTIWAGRTSSARGAHPEFSQDLEQWHIFKIQTENHTIKAFYDGVLLTTLPYDGEVGDVIGIRVIFKGTGSIDWAEVRTNGAANATFREDFTTCDEATATRQSRTIQYGDSLVFNGHTYRTTGTYRDTLSCDNMVITNLTVLSCVAQITSDVPNNQLTCVSPNATLTPSVLTGGVAPYTYRWENGSTVALRTVHRSGTYAVTITDANGCVSSSSIAVTSEPTRVELSFLPDTIPIITCLNESIRLAIPDSVLQRLNQFTYVIKRDGNVLAQGLAPAYPANRVFNVDAILGGVYNFEFTPLNTGCTVTGQMTILEARNRLNVNDFRITAPTTTLTCTTTSIPLTVVGANGNPLTGYTYAWTNTDFVGQVSNIRTVNAIGTDSVWVINTLTNCRSLLPQTIEIQQNIVLPTIAITASNPHFTCGINSIALTATGAATYNWNDNTTANPKSIPNAGTFTVTGTGANGCQNTANVTIGQIAGVVTLPQVNQTICQGSTLTIGNQSFTTAGDYTIRKTGRFRCDTTYMLRLSVEDSTFRQAISIAAGTSYTIGSSTYSVSGTYVNRVPSTNGCIRTVTTVLTVLPVGTPLDTNYRMPNVVIPCQGNDFCVEITNNNLNSNTKGWQGTIQYPSNCLQFNGGVRGSAIQAGFSNFVADSANREIRFAIAPSANVASIGTIARVCFLLKPNAVCNAPYLITASPVLESFTDNAQNRFVTIGSSRVTTTTNDTVNVSFFYANVQQAFGNLVGTGNAYTEVKSCNPNQVGVMLPNPQGKVVCKAGDTIQMKRYANTSAALSLSAVNSMDAYKIVQLVTRDVAAGTPDGMHWRAADTDGSGQILANDATAALRIAVGLAPVQYLWLPSTQADTVGFGLNPMRVPSVSNCISMPSAACTAQSMNILAIQRGDFWAQPVANDGRLAPLSQAIFMDLQHIARIGDTIIIPIGYQSSTVLNAIDLNIALANTNRLRLVNIEAKANFDQFLSNPAATLVQSGGFVANIGTESCILKLKIIATNGITPQESDFTATRSLINGNVATFGFKNSLNGCVMTTGLPILPITEMVRVYPNPTMQQLTIDYNESVKQLSIVNLLGQSLKTLEINASGRMDVDVSALPSGVYFLKINEKEMKKFVKL